MSTALATTAPADLIEITPKAEARFIAAQTEAAVAQQQAKELARSVGYEGALTVDALEDGIRFYQRRSVESLLECGKRLLLLREIVPHGHSCQIGTNPSFDERLEALGFSRRTAYRFMQAAAKAAKSAKLALLSGQMKNTSAFLELVTHDDDADIERVAALDDIERMSASQLRAALRESRAERQAQDKLLEAKQTTIDRLRSEAGQFSDYTPDEKIAKLHQQIHECADTTAQVIDQQLRTLLVMLQRTGDEAGRDMVASMSAAIGHIMSAAQRLREELGLLDVSSDAHLAAQARLTFGDATAAALDTQG